jgi:CheY-like chemotaxis protein
MESAPLVLILTDDLIFSSRIAAVAREIGAGVKTARNVEGLTMLTKSAKPSCVIVDLQIAGPDIANLVASMQALPARPRIVAYCSHVDAAGLDRATQAGCDIVLTRSKFVEALESELPKWLAVS